jgi:hypothetical protein
MTVRKNPAFTGSSITTDLQFDSFGDYYGPELTLPTQALNDGAAVRIPVQMVPNFIGIPRAQWCPFGPSSCEDIPGVTTEALENDWYNGRFDSRKCQRFLANGGRYGIGGDGARWFLGSDGIVFYWSIATHPGFASDEPFLPLACF